MTRIATWASGLSRCDDPNHCITCSDEGTPMRVVTHDAGAGLAWCVDEDGAGRDVMSALIDDVRAGDIVLVHAGTAISRCGTSGGPPT